MNIKSENSHKKAPHPYWTEKEDKILKENYYGQNKNKLLEMLPGRTLEACHTRLKKVLKYKK